MPRAMQEYDYSKFQFIANIDLQTVNVPYPTMEISRPTSVKLCYLTRVNMRSLYLCDSVGKNRTWSNRIYVWFLHGIARDPLTII